MTQLDLQPSRLFPAENVLAIGWLSAESDFEKGRVENAFFEKLKALCTDPYQPVVGMGAYRCDLCQFDSPGFSVNLFVPYQGVIYVAPVAIVHYIAQHWYKPPASFVEAVMACPEMRSMEYKKVLSENGGKGLLQ